MINDAQSAVDINLDILAPQGVIKASKLTTFTLCMLGAGNWGFISLYTWL